MRLFAYLFFTSLFASTLSAQMPYTVANKYGFRVQKDLVYGVAPNYVGVMDTLEIDIYKPLGDNNPKRPLIVLVYGGSWLAGCKEDVKDFAIDMARRGYVVACPNYRLGWHKDNYVPAPSCLLDGTQRNLYPFDSCEVIRALYRGQQDVKGAIRWMKGRAQQDSTDACKVLVGGISAGGFNALAVGFLDRPSEKPLCCFDLPDVLPPDPNMLNQAVMKNCALSSFSVTQAARARPNLGGIDGSLNQNGMDANVLGVINFFGGVPYEALPNNWLAGPDTPAVYLYHQTCDGVVPFGYGQPYFVISQYCNLGCTPWHYQTPNVYGSGAIAAALASMPGTPICYKTEFTTCPAFNPGLAFFECARYADNGSYHYVDQPYVRLQTVADFFSPFVTNPALCNRTSCATVDTKAPELPFDGVQVAPNPFSDRLTLFTDAPPKEPVLLELIQLSGQVLWRDTRVLAPGANALFQGLQIPAGTYGLRVVGKEGARMLVVECTR
jgi:acetyl esterase/lipase